MNHSLTWLHLSDWHQKDVDDLLRDIHDRVFLISDKLKRIDFIAFAGDVGYSRKKEGYDEAARRFFNPLLTEARVSKRRLFLVPGDRDMDHTRIHPDLFEKLNTPEEIKRCQEAVGLRRYLLEPMSDYTDFFRRYLGEVQRIEEPDFCYRREFSAGGKTIAVVGLNSAWLSGCHRVGGRVNDCGFLVLGEYQVRQAMDSLGADLVIALMHHPLDWLQETDLNRIQDVLQKHCHFLLSGHTHQQVKHSGTRIEIPMGPSTYNFAHIDFDNRQILLYLRRYRQGRWAADFDSANDGRLEFNLDDLSANREFDVFLCYNSAERSAIKRIRKRLMERGISPWMDVYDVPPGFRFQKVLEEQIENIKSAAVFVGEGGIGPWQDLEQEAWLWQFVKRGCRVIPVILSNCKKVPKLPAFLEQLHRVDFREHDPDPWEKLIEGITGRQGSP